MKLIVGLGNPGSKYAGTRHNVGFDVVDRLAKRLGVALTAEKFHAWFALGQIGTEQVAMLKPTTFMNRSGQAVLAAGRFYKLEAADLLVVVDDFALPLGSLRLRSSGSAGGHNGLQDIIDRLGTNEWSRLRIGIGAPDVATVGYVLGRFAPDEEPVADRAIERATDAVECWVMNGPEETMNRYNRSAE